MKEGLLWYDDNPGRDLAEKLRPAAARYRQKFGAKPDLCCVHPSTLPKGKPVFIDGIKVTPEPSVLRHHFWLGREEKRRRRPVQQALAPQEAAP